MNEEDIKNNSETLDPQTEVSDEQEIKEEDVDKSVEELLVDAQKEIEELKSQMLYKQAEFENYRKRVVKEKAELLLNGAEKTVLAMLPVLDDMKRAEQNLANATDVDALREGLDLIFQKFIKQLEGLGVKAIDTTDADFSVDLHEAIAQIPMPEKKGKVIDCVQTGYLLNEKVIRFAKVAVGV